MWIVLQLVVLVSGLTAWEVRCGCWTMDSERLSFIRLSRVLSRRNVPPNDTVWLHFSTSQRLLCELRAIHRCAENIAATELTLFLSFSYLNYFAATLFAILRKNMLL